jgi:hypothetical protein
VYIFFIFILFLHFVSWIGVELALLFTVMVGAAFMAFKTRNVPSAFDESAHIANAIFLLIFFAVIIVPLDILIQDSPNAAIIIQGIGQCFLGIMLLVVLFGPKLYYIASGRANDKKMLAATSGTFTNKKTRGPSNRTNAADKTSSTNGGRSNVDSNISGVPSNVGVSSVSPSNISIPNPSSSVLDLPIECGRTYTASASASDRAPHGSLMNRN